MITLKKLLIRDFDLKFIQQIQNQNKLEITETRYFY